MAGMSLRILVGGFQHETNTFAPTPALWPAFLSGESFPPLRRGEAMLRASSGCNLPVGGFIAAARDLGWTLTGSVWAGATPSAHVSEDAFERIAAMLLEDIDAALAGDGLDAVYLDLHGAAVCTHLDDPEGELLARVRERIGAQRALVASLDLHANVSARMLEAADALVAYREYPHVDMADTGRRAAQLLQRCWAAGRREALAQRRLPFLLALPVQCTLIEPARSVYALLAQLEVRHGTVLSFTPGFPAADVPCCGPVVWGHGGDAAAAVAALAEAIETDRARWRCEVPEADPVVAQALALLEGPGTGPVVIADTQDNPGAGGDSNTTGLLHALLRAGAGQRHPGRVALGLLHDPAAAAAAHAAGVDGEIELALGRAVPVWGGRLSDPPVAARWTVRALHDGEIALRGPMSMGGHASLGLCARLEHAGVQVLVSTGKCQMLDRALYRALGIQPEAMALLVNKSSVHFRADFAPIARAILVGKAAGPMPADPGDLPWTRLAPGMATRP
jgi:microcystin degradation protein MlrC